MSSQVASPTSPATAPSSHPAADARDAITCRPSDLVDHIEAIIVDWERSLDDEAVSETTAILPGGEAVLVRRLGFRDPEFVFVEGRDDAGHEVVLALPPSQLVLALTARSLAEMTTVQKADQPDHVQGFRLPRARAEGSQARGSQAERSG